MRLARSGFGESCGVVAGVLTRVRDAQVGFKELEQWALAQAAEPARESGKQELAERILDIFI